MAKKHIKDKEQGWKFGLFVNGLGAVTTGVVTIVIGVFKFTHGAWFIIILVPVMVFGLVRLNHAYESEKDELEKDAREAAEAPILRYHSVIVLVENLDQSSARAIQYARTLTPDSLKAVHIATDELEAEDLAGEWTRLGLTPCAARDRRVPRSPHQPVRARGGGRGRRRRQHRGERAHPPREYTRFWHRFLHDHTADAIAKTLSDVPHANVTFVPYHLGKKPEVSVDPPTPA